MTAQKQSKLLSVLHSGMLTITTSGVMYICNFLIELKEFRAETNTKMQMMTEYIDLDSKKQNQQDQRITYLEALLPSEIKIKKDKRVEYFQ